MIVRILVGHVLDMLAKLPDESVHCVVTSPPYYGLRDYGIEPQVWDAPQRTDQNISGTDDQTTGTRNEATTCAHDWSKEGKSEQRLRNGEGSNTAKQAVEVTLHPSTGALCLRCNAWRGSLGLEPTPSLYIEHMVTIFREVRRVMRSDATAWVNLGDGYSNKQLLQMPARVALALQADGWWLRSEITWAKKAPMPESATNRPTTATEKVFLLTKSGDSTYWTHRDHAGSRTKPAADYRWIDHDSDDAETDVEPPNWRTEPIAQKPRLSGIDQAYSAAIGGTHRDNSGGMGNTPTPHNKRWSRINLWDAHDYFYDAEAVKEEAEYGRREWTGDAHQTYDAGTVGEKVRSTTKGMGDGKRNMRNFWLLGPSPYPEAHFATFVPEIPRRAILAGTSEKGVCPKCWAPWERITSGDKYVPPSAEIGERNVDISRGDKTRKLDGKSAAWLEAAASRKTIGWSPTCKCDAGEPIPATVLDPFIGAGTTGLVADQLARDCIGIELSPEYAE